MLNRTAWLALLFTPGFTAAARKLEFKSPADRFELNLTDAGGTVDGKAANLRDQKEILAAITGDVAGACPTLGGAPDLTVRDGEHTREVFFKAGVVREGKDCLSVGGEELYRAPIHRDFLIGPTEGHLSVGTDLTLREDDRTLVSLRRAGTDWVSADAADLPNEDFFRKFTDRLASYSIRQRLASSAGEGKRHVTVRTANASHDFFKLADGAWGLKKAGAKWLEVSDDWSFWYDLDQRTLEDSYAEQIRFVGRAENPVGERLSQLNRLQATWSGNVRNLYRRILLEPNVDQRLVDVALRRLKTKPSRETAAVMVDVLESTQPDEIKRAAAGVLKLQNPKGPKFAPAAPSPEQRKVIDYWRAWLKKGST